MRRSEVAVIIAAAALVFVACSARNGAPASAPEGAGLPLAPAWSATLNVGGELQLAAAPGGFIVAAPSGKVLLVRAADGTIGWKKDVGAKITGSIALAGGASPASSGWVALPVEGAEVVLLPLAGGEPEQRWRLNEPSPILSSAGPELLAVSLDGTVRLYSPAAAKTLWETRLPPAAPVQGALCAGRILIGLASGVLAGLDAQTGKVQWKKDLGSPLAAAPSCSGHHGVAATADNFLHALRIHRRSAGFTWRARSGADPAAPPLLVRKTVLLLSKDTYLYGFGLRNGHLGFRIRLDRRPGPPAILGDIVLIAGSHAERLDAFRLPYGRSAGGFNLPEGNRFLTPPVISEGKIAIAVARYGEETSRLIALAPPAEAGAKGRAGKIQARGTTN